MTNLFSNMLTSICNAQRIKLEYTDIQYNKLCLNFLTALEEINYINHWHFNKNSSKKKTVRIYLKYSKHSSFTTPLFNNIKQISKKSNPVYISAKMLWKLSENNGIFIISTPLGILDNNTAKKYNVGGEVLCKLH